MTSKAQRHNRLSGISVHAATTALAFTMVMGLLAHAAQAQTYNVIYNFTGGTDGGNPLAGLSIDRAGNLYGTTYAGGVGSCMSFFGGGCGAVFRLHPSGSQWVLTPLYDFTGGSDGAQPVARVILGPDGALYGTTNGGGGGACQSGLLNGCGTVFALRPPATACKTALCSWAETQLYVFKGGADGEFPGSEVTFDQSGAIYGTTEQGGLSGGTVFQLTHSGGTWTESAIYSFTGGSDGYKPLGGVLFDKTGNLYGTTSEIGGCCGTVFELTPSGTGWIENTLYAFHAGNDGGFPYTGLISDTTGNLYGSTSEYGPNGGGTIFELTLSQGSWKFNLVYGLVGINGGPLGSLVMDATGNLYGTTYGDGAHLLGSVFKLTFSNGTWTYTSLHDFAGGTDGQYPYSNLVFNANGKLLYGTASMGGTKDRGVVFEIAP